MKALLTIDEVCAIAGVSKPTVYRKIKLGEFPAPTKVPTTSVRGPKLVNRWKKGAILDHVKAHSAAKAVANPPVEDTDEHWYESASKKSWTEEHQHSILAVIGGVLAGLAVWIFK
jgi:predicted DNA-binding transcriptional regulator AlpA